MYVCFSSQSHHLNYNTLRIITISSYTINNLLEVGPLIHKLSYLTFIPSDIVDVDTPEVEHNEEIQQPV